MLGFRQFKIRLFEFAFNASGEVLTIHIDFIRVEVEGFAELLQLPVVVEAHDEVVVGIYDVVHSAGFLEASFLEGFQQFISIERVIELLFNILKASRGLGFLRLFLLFQFLGLFGFALFLPTAHAYHSYSVELC